MLLLQTVVRGGELQGACVQQLSPAAGAGARQPAGLRPLGGAQAAPGGYITLQYSTVQYSTAQAAPGGHKEKLLSK